MQGGDIDNGVPDRFLVHLDVITVRKEHTEKVLKLFPVKRERRYYDRRALAYMWLVSERTGVTMELFDIGCDQEDVERVVSDLDNIGTHPFRYAASYESVAELVADLPYRHGIRGVIDLPERALRYGSHYYDLGRI